MNACEKCGAVYDVQRSLELKQNVRNICPCEKKRSCGLRRKLPCGDVKQALLDDEGKVEVYVCEEHAAQECLAEMAVPPTRVRRVKEEEKPAYTTPAEYAAWMEKMFDDPMVCLKCKGRHLLGKRDIRGETLDDITDHCPDCGAAAYNDDGPPYERTYVSEADFIKKQRNPWPEETTIRSPETTSPRSRSRRASPPS